MVELSTAFNIAVTAAAGAIGYLLKALFSRMSKMEEAERELAKAIADLRVELPTNYVRKEDFKQMGDNIFGAIRAMQKEVTDGMRRIEDKLESKQDKEK